MKNISDNTIKINNSGVAFGQTGFRVGTAFAYHINGNRYIISAEHIFKNNPHNSLVNFEYFYSTTDGIGNATGTIYKHPTIMTDIVVIVTNDMEMLTGVTNTCVQKHPTPLSEYHFAGFPYALFDNTTNRIAPFFKKAFMCGTRTVKGYTTFFLDGETNSGFSGGPVVSLNGDELLGVISADQGNNIGTIDDPKGTGFKLNITENAGLIRVASFVHAIEIIQSIP